MTREELIKEVSDRLVAAGFESAGFEARQMCFDIGFEATEDGIKTVHERLERRLGHEPLQYILGEWEFCGLPFKVGRGVLIPRQDTEALVERVLPLIKGGKRRVLDLCAGSGCIGIALERLGGAEVTALEKSREALKYLKENIKLNGSKLRAIEGDVFDEPLRESFDIIVGNPPYIRREVLKELSPEVLNEPETALDGGEDGLVFYRRIAGVWKSALNDGGYLAFEIGYDQQPYVTEIMKQNGFKNVEAYKDLAGQPRVVIGQI